jgi:putative membrane protein
MNGERDQRPALRRTLFAAALFALAAFVLMAAGAEAYLWVKALHVIAVIAWLAGLLYLPRLLVYHSAAVPGSDQSETFKLMEQRLLRTIMNPAMMVSWVIGLWLAWEGFGFAGGWLHLKLAAVIVLTGFHVYLARAVQAFASEQGRRDPRFWRLLNEVPTVLMIGIVILVVVKPF